MGYVSRGDCEDRDVAVIHLRSLDSYMGNQRLAQDRMECAGNPVSNRLTISMGKSRGELTATPRKLRRSPTLRINRFAWYRLGPPPPVLTPKAMASISTRKG